MIKTICIYHGNCADGFGAAWGFRHSLHGKIDNVEFYPGVYQEPPPDVQGKNVIMLDFSYKRDVVLQMACAARNILIIDHHKSAAADLVNLPSNVFTIFDINKSGAMLAWEYFNSDEPPPKLIEHIQDRDLWRFKLPFTREIQAGLFSHPYDFDQWDDLMRDPHCARLRDDGIAIERKHFKDIREFIRVAAFRTDIAGYNVPCLNAPYFWSSDAGHILAQAEPFAACYWRVPDGYVFSLRSASDGVDVSLVATQYGGGGHHNAAGFKVGLDHELATEL